MTNPSIESVIDYVENYAKSIEGKEEDCWYGYLILIIYHPYARMRGIDFKYGWYAGSAGPDRILDRIEEDCYPTHSGIYNGQFREWCERSYCYETDNKGLTPLWLTRAKRNYDANVYFIKKFKIRAKNKEEAAEIWDCYLSRILEQNGALCFGK